MENLDGRRWARWALSLSLLVSVVGNVTHTVLTDSVVSLRLRIPGAVIWPVFVFLGIEILVRVNWQRTVSHRFARLMILWPVVPAAITSYDHLRSLLGMMAERPFIAIIGPGAIDGMMIGCTLVLLLTRSVPAVTEDHTLSTIFSSPAGPAPMDAADVLAAKDEQTLKVWASEVAPVSPAPQNRAPRATWDARKVAEMVLDGSKDAEIVLATQAGRASIGRFRKVAKTLQRDPRAPIDAQAEKVRPEHISIIRELVNR